MSQAARIKLIGKTKEQVLQALDEIEVWDNGANHPVYLDLYDTDGFFSDTIANIREGVKVDLEQYVRQNWVEMNKHVAPTEPAPFKITRQGSHPVWGNKKIKVAKRDKFHLDNTPKKKKRKKNKRTTRGKK